MSAKKTLIFFITLSGFFTQVTASDTPSLKTLAAESEAERKTYEETKINNREWRENLYSRRLKALSESRQENKKLNVFYILPWLATFAISLEKNDEAMRYVEEMETLIPNFFPDAKIKDADWVFGRNEYRANAMTCNIVRGQLALRNGELEKAKEYLLAAGHIWNNPIKYAWERKPKSAMSSWGPSMTLAKDLLKKGEKQVVLKYLDLCRNNWISMDTVAGVILDRWKKEITDGKIPYFGKNLLKTAL